jgi:hypothetical protein
MGRERIGFISGLAIVMGKSQSECLWELQWVSNPMMNVFSEQLPLQAGWGE